MSTPSGPCITYLTAVQHCALNIKLPAISLNCYTQLAVFLNIVFLVFLFSSCINSRRSCSISDSLNQSPVPQVIVTIYSETYKLQRGVAHDNIKTQVTGNMATK